MQARGVPIALVPKVWPLVVGWIAASLTAGKADIDADEVLRRLDHGSMQLWLLWDDLTERAKGCLVTELCDSVRGNYCNLVVVAGYDFKSWRHCTETIKQWARARGCVRLEGGGREGWERLVKSDGWRKVRTIVEMRLDDDGCE
jgi:hypothetical protein